MSRDIFGDELGRDSRADRKPYEPGIPQEMHKLGHQIADQYLSSRQTYNERAVTRMVQSFNSELNTLQEGEAQTVLDTIVSRLELEAEGIQNHNTSYLFGPLLNGLYSRGHNDFFLDLTLMKGFAPRMLRHVYGGEDDLLSITCILTPSTWQKGCEVAKFSQYIDLTISGSIQNIGCWSKDSTFTIGSEARQIGYFAENCTFRLEGIDSYELTISDEPQYIEYESVKYDEFLGSFSGQSIYKKSNCFKLKLQHGDETFISYLDREFTDNNNELLISDGEGGWKEVKL